MRHPKNSVYEGLRLSDHPRTEFLGIACTFCPHRRGRYRLSRLETHFGPRILLDDLRETLVRCKWLRPNWSRPPGKYEPRCRALFSTLDPH